MHYSKNQLAELKTKISIMVFNEQSICDFQEKEMIAQVFLNRLKTNLKYNFFDIKDTNGFSDKIEKQMKGFHGYWNDFVLKNSYDKEVYQEQLHAVENQLDYFKKDAYLETQQTFYQTKELLQNHDKEEDLFKTNLELIRVDNESHFHHTFYAIKD